MQKNMDSFAARCFQIGAKKYFEVENQFVLRKLAFICFPFYKIGKKDTQEDDPQFEDQSQLSGAAEAAQETLKDVTDTDLYVPLMAFISYTILSCLYLGISSKFNPSLIASNFSNCLALTLIEALIFKLIIWTMLEFNPLYLQLLSVVSYKYLG